MAASTAVRPTPAVDLDAAFAAVTAGVEPTHFVSRDDVESVAAHVRTGIGTHVGALVGGEHLNWLAISPGTVAIRLDHRHGMDAGDGLAVDDLELVAGAANDRLEVDPQGVLFDVDDAAGKRGRIVGWSRGSRRRMHRTLAELDYSEWLAGPGTLAVVTATVPGLWEPLVPDAPTWKWMIERLRLRWRHEVKMAWAGPWKMEFQERGAPHQHMLLKVPSHARTGEQFEDWYARVWSDIVGAPAFTCHRCHRDHLGYDAALGYGVDRLGYDAWLGYDLFGSCDCEHPDTDRARHRARHGRGTRAVSFDGMATATDPRRISLYFGKHGAKSASKQYQNRPNDQWVAQGTVGRFWGVWGLRKAVVEISIDLGTMHRARRILRHVARARAATVAISRLRAAGDAAGIRSMPRQHVRSLTTGGGWVLVNDGLSLALALRRALSQP